MNLNCSGIYKIESPSRKFYIGSAANLRKRFNEHRGSFYRGDHVNAKLRHAAKKYGAEKLEISVLVICERYILREFEQRFIDYLKPEYNIEQTVGKILHDFWTDPEWRKKNAKRCSEQNKERWKDPEYRAAMAGSEKSMQTPEARKKSVDSKRRAFAENSPAGLKLRNLSSKRMSDLHRDPAFRKAHAERVSKKAKMRLSDQKEREKLFNAAAKANSRPICCETTGECFQSLKLAAKSKGISISVIKKQMNGLSTKTGYVWRYLDEQEAKQQGLVLKKTLFVDPKYKNGAKLKPVSCKELGIVFSSIKNAAAAFGSKSGHLISSAIIKNHRAFGYYWEFFYKEVGVRHKEYSFGELAHLKRDLRPRKTHG